MILMKYIFNLPQQKPIRRKLRNNATEAEQKLWGFLRKKGLGYKFIRQYGISCFVVDFYCPQKKLVVELDGAQHNFEENMAYDQTRTKIFNDLGITVLRFWNTDIFNNIDTVCEEIKRHLEE